MIIYYILNDAISINNIIKNHVKNITFINIYINIYRANAKNYSVDFTSYNSGPNENDFKLKYEDDLNMDSTKRDYDEMFVKKLKFWEQDNSIGSKIYFEYNFE